MTPLATNWDRYYDRPAPTAHLTRRYTAHWLQSTMRRYTAGKSQLSVIEFGGGNSCFFRGIAAALPVARYEIVDLNAKSLELFERQGREVPSVKTAAHRADLLKEAPGLEPADIVYSVGLIEHFSPEGTREVARRHFSCVKPGGIVIVTAPTPTWLYRAVRGAAEAIGVWAFPDERPLQPAEIAHAGEGLGTICHAATLWPQVLTQHAVVWRALAR
jgi:cyclopropane fatty-acyl-phospholipid synthase-like methyltransferase